MDDLISRRAAIDALCDNCDHVQSVCPHYPCKQYTAIDTLPSAQPERKKGKWLKRGSRLCYKCSECDGFSIAQENYCPNCGADMRGDKDAEIHQ